MESSYDLEIPKIISEIKKVNAKTVLLQFPDGLKPYATSIVDYLRGNLGKKWNGELMIWLGSCFGACDIPVGIEKLKPKIDLLVQFGHSEMMPNY